jgi:hypothetical protein
MGRRSGILNDERAYPCMSEGKTRAENLERNDGKSSHYDLVQAEGSMESNSSEGVNGLNVSGVKEYGVSDPLLPSLHNEEVGTMLASHVFEEKIKTITIETLSDS